MTDMHHHTELSFVDEFRWVPPFHYLKNGWEDAVLLWCMLQAGPPSLHYYCAVVLHSCIVLPPVSHSSNHEYHCWQLTRQSAMFGIFIAILSVSFDFPSYIWSAALYGSETGTLRKVDQKYLESSEMWYWIMMEKFTITDRVRNE